MDPLDTAALAPAQQPPSLPAKAADQQTLPASNTSGAHKHANGAAEHRGFTLLVFAELVYAGLMVLLPSLT
jgi:hypothetical protein